MDLVTNGATVVPLCLTPSTSINFAIATVVSAYQPANSK
jgi:hypothetical protein